MKITREWLEQELNKKDFLTKVENLLPDDTLDGDTSSEFYYIFSGQALASLVFSHLFDVKLLEPKDLDIFYFSLGEPLTKFSNIESNGFGYSSTRGYTVLQTVDIIQPQTRINYICITSHLHDALLYFMKHQVLDDIVQKQLIEDIIHELSYGIIRGFDLNLVQVGYDIQKKKVFFTDKFIQFLNTRIIEPTLFPIPANTIVRAFNKLHQLKNIPYIKLHAPLYDTVHVTPKILANLRNIILTNISNIETILNNIENSEHVTHWYIKSFFEFCVTAETTRKNTSDFLNMEIITPTIKLHKALSPKYTFPLLQIPKRIFLIQANRFLMSIKKSSFNFKEFPSDVQSIIHHINRFLFQTPIKQKSKLYKVFTIHDIVFTLSSLKFMKKSKLSKASKIFRMILSQNFSFLYNKSIFEFLTGIYNEELLYIMKHWKIIQDHMILFRLHRIKDFYIIIKFLKTYPKSIRNLIIGFLEDQSFLLTLSENESLQKYARYIIDKDLRNMKKTYKDTRITISDNSIFLKELISDFELIEEGDRMHNCVGGYSRRVKQKMSLIFHGIDSNTNDHFTLEVQYDYTRNRPTTTQIYKASNKPVHQTTRLKVQDILEKYSDTFRDAFGIPSDSSEAIQF